MMPSWVVPVHELRQHFSRDRQGSWTCMKSATLELPTGHIEVAVGTRFTRGTSFMGVDLAALLDEEHEISLRLLKPPNFGG
jgi:hypothetical protein